MTKIELNQIRDYRLGVHHLDKKIPPSELARAAGACGLQNSPPGAWETALFNRLEGCTLPMLRAALYEEKSLLQAWSFRGAPVVFPTGQSGVFLTALLAREGEQPWIYTLGISGALEFLQMSFDDLLQRTRRAAEYLDSHVVKSKQALDGVLARLVQEELPAEKQALWTAPSMYGRPDRQTMGGAAVSFLLRPCAFDGLVVFGRREGSSPTFTSFQNWVGRPPEPLADGEAQLVRKFLHCYGPAAREGFMSWLGCSRRQASRLWDAAAQEMEPVAVGNKTRFMLSADMERLTRAGDGGDRLLLLGPHDPYLDIRDKGVLLEEEALQKAVWKTVGNPGAVVKGGRVVGIWKTNTQKERLEVTMTVFEALQASEHRRLKELAEEYAAFRLAGLKRCEIKENQPL